MILLSFIIFAAYAIIAPRRHYFEAAIRHVFSFAIDDAFFFAFAYADAAIMLRHCLITP